MFFRVLYQNVSSSSTQNYQPSLLISPPNRDKMEPIQSI